MDAEEKRLWETRDKRESVAAIYQLYSEQVERLIAHRLRKMSLPPHCDFDALENVARMAVFQAIASFEPERHVQFMTFIGLRIFGAMVDELRQTDVSRSVRKAVNERLGAEFTLQSQLGREPSPEEVCDLLGWDRQQYLFSTPRAQTPLDAIRRAKHADRPFMPKDLIAAPKPMEAECAFQEICRGLSIEEQTILFLYYWRGNSMKTVGSVLRLSESRISQMHSRLLERLRERGHANAVTALSA